MKKLVLILVIGMSSLFASSGEEVYKAKCQMCHAPKGMMDKEQMKTMRAKMQNATKEEKMAMREKMVQNMKKKGMRAPSISKVSARLHKKFQTREQFIAFVEDYIVNPSKDKGLCKPMAYKKFGVMPPIGKGMSKEDRASVAAWVYDTYKDAETCDMSGKGKAKGMKCGGGKCGSASSTKKSSTKCGAVAIPTH